MVLESIQVRLKGIAEGYRMLRDRILTESVLQTLALAAFVP